MFNYGAETRQRSGNDKGSGNLISQCFSKEEEEARLNDSTHEPSHSEGIFIMNVK